MSDTPIIPRELLFGDPERDAAALSPDGSTLAWLAPADGVLNVWVGGSDLADPRPITRDRDRGIHTVAWAHDGRHLLYIQDEAGDENWRLHAVDLESGTDRDLTPFDGVQARLVAMEKHRPDEVLVGLNRDDPQLHDVYRLRLSTGELELVLDNPGFIDTLADADLRVRAAMAALPDGGMAIHVRDAEDAPWRVLLEVPQDDALGTMPMAFDRDGTGLFVVSSFGSNTSRLLRYDLRTGDADVLASDPRYDVTDVRLDPDTRELLWVSFLRERLHHEAVSDEVADDLAALDDAARGDVLVLGQDHARRTWVVRYDRDDGPASYHLYDRTSRTLRDLFTVRPELDEHELARMRPIELTARDGLPLHGYLTLPVDADGGTDGGTDVPAARPDPMPTVLLVHGGPWARDVWGFDPEVQWLANRGYAVLQVNFRGSAGYGKAFLNAGDREWGAKMHDDLLDAVDWAIEAGYSDPERIAICGGSYGGYAALVGATLTPERFACAVDLVGPSNLKTLIESVPPYWEPMVVQFHNRIGHPERDEALLWERSPLSRVDNVSIPLLIAQGANDPRVKQAESEQIVAALEQRGIPHEYLLFDDEGHGFVKPANRMRYYAAVETFLADHLGGRTES